MSDEELLERWIDGHSRTCDGVAGRIFQRGIHAGSCEGAECGRDADPDSVTFCYGGAIAHTLELDILRARLETMYSFFRGRRRRQPHESYGRSQSAGSGCWSAAPGDEAKQIIIT